MTIQQEIKQVESALESNMIRIMQLEAKVLVAQTLRGLGHKARCSIHINGAREGFEPHRHYFDQPFYHSTSPF